MLRAPIASMTSVWMMQGRRLRLALPRPMIFGVICTACRDQYVSEDAIALSVLYRRVVCDNYFLFFSFATTMMNFEDVEERDGTNPALMVAQRPANSMVI